MNTNPPFKTAKRRVHRKRRQGEASPTPPPVAVLLTAVHVQQAGDTLEFVFDSDIVQAGGAFECTVDGEPVFFDSIDSLSGAGIIVYFGRDVSTATVGTLISGEGLVFSNGGVAANGQAQPVTGGAMP
jgi:hypothetical protein